MQEKKYLKSIDWQVHFYPLTGSVRGFLSLVHRGLALLPFGLKLSGIPLKALSLTLNFCLAAVKRVQMNFYRHCLFVYSQRPNNIYPFCAL
jgi:hypothetical protein